MRPWIIPLIATIALTACQLPLPTPSTSTPVQPAATPAATRPTPSPSSIAVPTLEVGPPTSSLPDPNTVPVPAADSCHVQPGNRPDPACTPGLLNSDISVVNGRLVISVQGRQLDFCSSAFSTRMIRPPETYTNPLKLRLMESYGMRHRPARQGDLATNQVELDHDIGLEDIGHPYAVGNLWPMPRAKTAPGNQPTGLPGPYAEQKDTIETRVHRLECADPAKAAEYAARLAADWHSFETTAEGGTPEPTTEPEP